MKLCTMLVLIFITSQISAQTKCEKKVHLAYKGKKVELCHNEVKDTYLSEENLDLSGSFFNRDIKLALYKNQSPGFSLCYQLGGEAFFGPIHGLDKKIPMCRKKNHFADQESLLLHYRDIVSVK